MTITSASSEVSAKLLDRVAALLPTLAARSDQGESDRRLPEASAKDFLDVGLAQVFVPREFGGMQLSLDTWFEAVTAIGTVDAAQAWCASLIIHHPQYVAAFPRTAQEAVWAEGPDVAVAATVNPTTKVTIVDGGYLLTGEGAFTSGIGHSSWVIVGGMLPVAGPPQPALFLLPRTSYTIRDDWNTIGMRATGSNVVVTEEVFVPSDRMLLMADLLDGSGPGVRQHDDPGIYGMPLVSYAPIGFLAPMLGAARGAQQRFTAYAKPKMARANATVTNASTRIQMGRADADLDAAELLLRRAMGVALSPEGVTLHERARAMRDWSRAAELIIGAVDAYLRMSGTAAFTATNDLQKIWRDVNLAARHVTLNSDTNYAHWSGMQLGLPRNPAEQPMF